MRSVFEFVPVIADVISAHCPHTAARRDFMRACISEDWQEAKGMVQKACSLSPGCYVATKKIGSASSWS